MKKKCIILLVLILLPCQIIGCAEEISSIDPEYVRTYVPQTAGALPEFIAAFSVPEMPEQADTYRIVYPTVTESFVIETARKFGVTGTVTEGTDGFSVVDEQTGSTLEVFTSGAIWYNPEPYREIHFSENAALPSEKEAVGIAVQFLEERDLLPSENKQYAKAGTGGTIQGKPGHILVSFRYTIGEHPVEGPGFRFLVRVGNNGEPGEVFIYCPEVERRKSVLLLPVEKAFGELQKGNGSWTTYNEKTIILEEVELRYYLQPVNETQEYVLPVYVFQGYGLNDDGTQGNEAQAIVNAVDIGNSR
jgi:hypothetical protein